MPRLSLAEPLRGRRPLQLLLPEEEIFSAPGLEWIPPLGQIAARGLDTPLEEMAEAELRELCEEVEWASNLDEEAPSSDR